MRRNVIRGLRRLVVHLASLDRDLEPVFVRRQRTSPLWVIGARRVVGVVEVDHDLGAAGSHLKGESVGVLDGVEQVAATPIRLFPGGRVPKGQKQTAAVSNQR